MKAARWAHGAEWGFGTYGRNAWVTSRRSKAEGAGCRALAGEPRLLLLDEPTASVDARSGKTFAQVLRKLRKSMTIIMVSDLQAAQDLVDRIVCVSRKLRWISPAG